MLPNVRLDARRVLFQKIDSYCINPPPERPPVSPPGPPVIPPIPSPLCVDCKPPQIPEPGTFWLAGVGITAALLMRRRIRRRNRSGHRF
jgi:hypothetical protein